MGDQQQQPSELQNILAARLRDFETEIQAAETKIAAYQVSKAKLFDDLRNLANTNPELSRQITAFISNNGGKAQQINVAPAAASEESGVPGMFSTTGRFDFGRKRAASKRRPSYNSFVKKQMRSRHLSGLTPRRRMAAIADMWRNNAPQF